MWFAAQYKDSEDWLAERDKTLLIFKARCQFGSDIGFWVVEGSAMKLHTGLFGGNDFFADEEVLAQKFDDMNEEFIGEDAQGSAGEWSSDHVRELEKKLDEVFEGWASKHGYDKAWYHDFDEATYQWVPRLAVAADFGTVEDMQAFMSDSELEVLADMKHEAQMMDGEA